MKLLVDRSCASFGKDVLTGFLRRLCTCFRKSM